MFIEFVKYILSQGYPSHMSTYPPAKGFKFLIYTRKKMAKSEPVVNKNVGVDATETALFSMCP